MSKTILFIQLTFGAADGDPLRAGHPWGVQAFLHTSGNVKKKAQVTICLWYPQQWALSSQSVLRVLGLCADQGVGRPRFYALYN